MADFLPKKYKLPFEDKTLQNNEDIERLIDEARNIAGSSEFLESIIDFYDEHKGLTKKQTEALINTIEYLNNKDYYDNAENY